jgi:nucleotide-binding universal stress UspA family protein
VSSFARILVPVDFSVCSESAFRYALAVGRRCQSVVDVLHVFQTSTVTPVTPARAKAKEALKSFVGRTKVYGSVELRRRVEYGDPFLTILNVATLGSYSLIVQGARGKNDHSSRHLGHVTESLVATSPCPLALVPAIEDSQREWWPADEGPERPGVLVPVGPRLATGASLAWAASLASRMGVGLEPLFADEERDLTALQNLRDLLGKAVEATQPPIVKERIVERELGDAVLSLALERRHDAIVTGVGRDAGVLHGSSDELTEQLVRQSMTPLVVVPGSPP